MPQRIAVIGAGISGLTCAYELQKAGFEVTVYEKREAVGGRMATRTKDGLNFDIGANHLCHLYTEMKKYCVEFGIPWEKMSFEKYGIFKDGKILPIDQSVSLFSRFKFFWRAKGKRRIFDFFNLSNAADLDTDNGYHFVEQGVNKETADYLADGFTSTYQFHGAKEMSNGALIALMDSIQNDKGGWDLYQMRGGMSALPEALAARLNVKKGVAVTSVEAKEGKVEVMTSVSTEIFDAAVLASTANVTNWIYKNPTDAQHEILEKTEYASTVSVAFRVPVAILPKISVVWVPFIQSQTISGYTNETMKGDALIKDGKSLLCVWFHDSFAQTLIQKTDDEIYVIARKELMRVCPWVTDEAMLGTYDLERWPQAMPKFSHGHLRRVKAFLENGQGDNNVFFCGDYLNSLWTEGSLRGGQRVAAQIKEKASELVSEAVPHHVV